MANSEERIEDDPPNVGERCANSDIQRFYDGKTILLTGSTGYVGKCLTEKLLRACPGVERIYLLVRKKRGISAEKRITEYFEDALFDTLRESQRDFKSKIHLVPGDLTQDGIGLSETDVSVIIDQVNVILHVASIVKFDERMHTALRVNVLGTKMMLDLAKSCKRLEAFLYCSTAYSHCYEKHIMEKTYPPPADMKAVESLIKMDSVTSTGLTNEALAEILGDYPNTYTFTKGIAESLVNEMSKQVSFPCIIYRPSVVMSSWKEPVRGWCGNSNGPTLVTVAYGLGILHAAMVPRNIVDFIPVDMSTNAILVSVWDAVCQRPRVSEALIYNHGTSVEKPLSIRDFKEMCVGNDKILTPSIRATWTNFVIFTECFWYFAILHVLFHFLPALILDAIALATGKKPRGLSAFKKLNKSYRALSYFVNNEWKIDVTNMNRANDRLSEIDRKLFFSDVRKLDWRDYCSSYWDGIRVYIVKDPMSTLPAAKQKARIFETLNSIIKYGTIFFSVLAIIRFVGLL